MSIQPVATTRGFEPTARSIDMSDLNHSNY